MHKKTLEVELNKVLTLELLYLELTGVIYSHRGVKRTTCCMLDKTAHIFDTRT